MTNIWAFLLQTLTVTLTAGVLLVVKAIFQDKLSPRWQYGAWSVLVLRHFIPVSLNTYFIVPLSLWIEQFKATIEQILSSTYTSVYEPLKMKHSFPVMTQLPTSITDFLFVIYAIGILFFLAKYIIAYTQLKHFLKHGTPVSEKLEYEIQLLSKELHVKPCRAIVLNGIQSAFITGCIHPVLVLPETEIIDRKILMHELMHMKYHDALQNIFWCLMRAFHWCNPIMHLVFDRISNDMESLCDQRVLECLEGEDLREYGLILLKMANDKYARAVGTSSISNGGKNIAKRIEAIARFKKYPKGMALVSICILCLLSGTLIKGNAYEVSYDTYSPANSFEFEQAMALTRLHRCTTLAGAIDTYAKSLILENGLYLATASPLSQQESIYRQITEGQSYSQFKASNLLKEIPYNSSYCVYNLTKISDSLYQAALLIGKGYSSNETDKIFLQNISILKEDDWIVIPDGNPILLDGGFYDFEFFSSEEIGEVLKLQMTGEYGTVTIRTMIYHEVTNTSSDNGITFYNHETRSLKTDAEFDYINTRSLIDYDYSEIVHLRAPEHHVQIQTCMVTSKDEEPSYYLLPDSNYSSRGSGNQTTVTARLKYIHDHHLRSSGGSSYSAKMKKQPFEDCYGFYVRILWDGEIVEELFLERGAQ